MERKTVLNGAKDYSLYTKGVLHRKYQYKYMHLMEGVCANPKCIDGSAPCVHHILLLSRGGEDAYWNLICLCEFCHHGLGVHSRYDELAIEIFTWKCAQELNKFGFVLDERDFGDVMAFSHAVNNALNEIYLNSK